MATISNLAVKLSINAIDFHSGVKDVVTSVTSVGNSAKRAVFGLKDLGSQAEETRGSIGRLSDSAKTLVKSFLGIATAGGGVALGVKLAAEYEQTEIAFKTMLGSAEAAKAMLADLSDFAAQTPFEMPELAQASKTLLAYQIPAGEILTTLRRLSDVSSATGSSLQELALSYGKAATQGKLLSQDVREFTGRGVPLIKLLAQQFKVTEKEVNALVTSGKVGFDQLKLAIATATSEGGMFYRSTINQSRTLLGLWSTLKDSVGILFRVFGQSFVAASQLSEAVTSVTGTVNNFQGVAVVAGHALGTLVRWVTKLIKPVTLLVAGWKVFAATVGLAASALKILMFVKITNWILQFAGLPSVVGLFVKAISTIPAAFRAASKAVVFFMALSGPKQWAMIAAGITAAALATIALNKAYDMASGKLSDLNAESDRLTAEAEQIKKELAQLQLNQQLAADIESASQAASDFAKEYRKAYDASEQLAGKLRDEVDTFGLSDSEKKVREYIESIYAINEAMGMANPRQLLGEDGQADDVDRFRAQLKQLEAMEAKKKLAEEIAGLEKKAAQVNMTDAQKQLATLRELAEAAGLRGTRLEVAMGRARSAMEDVAEAARQKKQLDDAIEAKKRAIGSPQGPKSLYDQLMDIENNVSKGFAESPKALLKGSTDAALAENRMKNPIEKLTDLQKQQIAKLEKQIRIEERQLAEMQKEKLSVAQF